VPVGRCIEDSMPKSAGVNPSRAAAFTPGAPAPAHVELGFAGEAPRRGGAPARWRKGRCSCATRRARPRRARRPGLVSAIPSGPRPAVALASPFLHPGFPS